MASNNLPDFWSITDPANVAWGTDIDREESTIYSGRYGIHFFDTTPSVDPEIQTDLIQIEGDAGLVFGMLVQADSVTAGDTIRIDADLYAADGITLNGTVNGYNAVLAATNTWEFVGGHTPTGSGDQFARLRIKKNNTAFNAYVDRVFADQFVSSWGRRRTTTQSIGTSSWTTIDFDAVDLATGGTNIQEVRVSESAGVITIGMPGSYSISAAVELEALTNGGTVDIRAKIIARVGGGAVIRYRYGTKFYSAAGTEARAVIATQHEPLYSGDTVEIQVWHNEGGSVNATGGSDSNTYFRGAHTGNM